MTQFDTWRQAIFLRVVCEAHLEKKPISYSQIAPRIAWFLDERPEFQRQYPTVRLDDKPNPASMSRIIKQLRAGGYLRDSQPDKMYRPTRRGLYWYNRMLKAHWQTWNVATERVRSPLEGEQRWADTRE